MLKRKKVKAKIWLILFIIDAVLHLFTTIYEFPVLNLVTKPLLMILLGGHFMAATGDHNKKINSLVVMALVASWFGDTFLMLQRQNPLFFILGLSSFLLAHIAYIIVFFKFESKRNKPVVIFITIVFVVYSLILAYILWPELGAMKIPVLVYALVLTVMGITGVVKNYRYSIMIVIGAVLFMISDSLIAYDKFVATISNDRFLIMFTYILAQYLLIKGLSARIFKIYS